jgi:hypothetical protein
MLLSARPAQNRPSLRSDWTRRGSFWASLWRSLLNLWLTGLVLLAGAVLVLHTALHGALVALPSIVVTLGALACAGTLYGALTAGGETSATLLPVLALPAFAPLLIAGERSFYDALHGGDRCSDGGSSWWWRWWRMWPWEFSFTVCWTNDDRNNSLNDCLDRSRWSCSRSRSGSGCG